MQRSAFNIHLVKLQGAGLGNPQAVAKHEKQQATVASFKAAHLGGGEQFFNLESCEMFSVVQGAALTE
jgi:hypothetical protein